MSLEEEYDHFNNDGFWALVVLLAVICIIALLFFIK